MTIPTHLAPQLSRSPGHDPVDDESADMSTDANRELR
jgi:hypothetical protein